MSAQSINDLFTTSGSAAPSQVTSPRSSQPPNQPSRTPDPFAALSSTPRQGSPYQFHQSVKPPPAGPAVVDLLGGDGSHASVSNTGPSQESLANDDDEWNFASSVPDTNKEITVTNTNINVLFSVARETDTSLLIQSRISNNTPLPISGLTLQVAASKVSKPYTAVVIESNKKQGAQLQLEPQSGVTLAPNQRSGITQNIRINNVQRGSGTSVKMRWKASYSLGSQQKNEMGEIPSLGVS